MRERSLTVGEIDRRPLSSREEHPQQKCANGERLTSLPYWVESQGCYVPERFRAMDLPMAAATCLIPMGRDADAAAASIALAVLSRRQRDRALPAQGVLRAVARQQVAP